MFAFKISFILAEDTDNGLNGTVWYRLLQNESENFYLDYDGINYGCF